MSRPKYSLALLWAATAAIAGTLTVAVLGGFLLIFDPGYTGSVAAAWLRGAFTALFFGGFVALVCILPYTLVLLAWQQVVLRIPAVDQSRAAVFWSCCLLALPVSAIVFYSTLSDAGFAVQGEQALFKGSLVQVGGWLGLFLPRVRLKRLQPGLFGVAA